MGKKYGKLLVIEYTGRQKSRHRFNCRCDCGNVTNVEQWKLINGYVKSCGCLSREQTIERKLKDITGQKFGLLTVIERVRIDGIAYWKCLCDCGNEKIVLHSYLTQGNVKSCGCINTKNISGKTYGYLTVIKRVDGKDKLHSYWECICKCGNIKIAKYSELVNNQTKSCGCYDITEYDKTIVGKKFNKLLVLYRTKTKNNEGYYLCKCDCGNLKEIRGTFIKGGKQFSCGCERRKKGKSNKRWTGTNIVERYLRGCIQNWYDKTKEKYSYLCIITNDKAEVVHHLYPFHKIIKEMFIILNINPKENINDYSNDELLLMRETVIKLHEKYGLGVCLTNEIHREFHKVYGHIDFSEQDFYTYYINKTGKNFIN